MSKRLLALIALVFVGLTSQARAFTTTPAGPFDAGDTPVGTTSNVMFTIEGANGEVLHHATRTGQCAPFTFTTTPPLPQILNGSQTLAANVAFSPSTRGTFTCTYSIEDASNASQGTFTVTGTGTGAAIVVTPQNGPPLDFGAVRVLDTATVGFVERTVTIANPGEATLSISSLTFTSATAGAAANYTISPSGAQTIAAGASRVFTIRFNPSAPGARDATLTIASNAVGQPSTTVPTQAVGTNARIALAPATLSFPVVETSQSATVTVANAGAAPQGPLRVASVSIVGDSAGWFSLDDSGFGCTGATCALGADVVGGAPLSIGVTCTPKPGAVGARNATLSFASDTDAGPATTVALTCTGRADHTVDTTTLAFGTQPVNTTSTIRRVTISNVGNNIDLTVNVSRSAGSSMFAISGCTSSCTIPAGTSKTLDVTFTPPAANTDYNATLTIVDNDPDADSVIALSGRGIAPILQTSATLEFGSVEVGQSGTEMLTVTNVGEAGTTLTISSAMLNANATQYAIVNAPASMMIPAGGTATWTIACNPTAQGDIPGAFVITSNSYQSATTTVPLNCTGLQGVLATTGSVNFGNVTENTTPADLSFTITNTGNVPVTGITATKQPNAPYFTLTNVPAMLAAGQSAVVTVRYRPTDAAHDGPVVVTLAGTWGSSATPTSGLTITLNGNALSAGYDVSPSTLNLGDVRFDGTVTGTFCISLTGQSAFDVTMLPVTLGATTLTGEITVTRLRRIASCTATTGEVVALPERLGDPSVTAGEDPRALEVQITAKPNNRTGMLNATVTVMTSLGVNRMVTVTARSTSATIAVDPATNIDFGAVDVQATTPTTRTVTITNMGEAPLDLTNFVRADAMAGGTLTFTLPANTVLQPGASVSIELAYKPTLVEPMAVAISHGIAGVLNGPASGTITVTGRGIDRDFDLLSATETFPDTFRNPGSQAPVKPITVRNLGEAPLQITAVMVTGDATVWQLVDPTPVTIPGLGSHDFLVRFTPTMSGPAPEAALELMHDDDMHAMTPIARVPLNGNGVDRQVNFTTPVINLGFTGVGIPFTLEDGIEVQSLDATNEFTITRIELDDASVFQIDGAEDVRLAPSATQRFSVTFSPTEAGEFTAMALLYLDEDPLAQRQVMITGTAVFVDAHGGGGCSTGSGAGGGMLLLVLAAVVGRLRRRVASVAAVAAVVAVPSASADNIVLSIFDPTPSTTTAGFQVASPEVGDDGEWVATAVGSYATDQFVHSAYVADGQLLNEAAAVKQSSLLLLGGAYALKGRFELGARVPLYQQRGDELGDRFMEYPGDPASGNALGDLTLHGKVQLVKKRLEGNGLFVFGGVLHLTLPTGTDQQFTGVDSPTARGLLLMTLRPGAFDNRVTITVNGGGVGRGTARYANLEQKSGATFGLGLAVRALERVWLDAEMFGDFIPSGQQPSEMSGRTVLRPIEWIGGLRWYPDHRVAIGLGAGRGLTSSAGSPALRGVLTFTYSPGASKPPRLHIPAVDLDSDEDGLRDSADRCKFQPEDKDQFEDTDGCVDADNDGDKLADGDDKCPMQAEDADGFEDADGCPDKDNDADGVADAADRCGSVAEDKDGFEDVDGCPETDNDRDGIEDKDDGCKDQPETINGNKDQDGCPDAGDALVILSPDRIETMDVIKFTGGAKIAKSSNNVLGQVAATLRAHPEIVRVRVTVHVHDVANDGNDARDQELSTKRAEAVRDWIVQWGIPANRVEARGFGSSKPLGKTAAINERVDLIILERK